MDFEPVLISALALGVFALVTLLAGHFTMERHRSQRFATILHASRARNVARLVSARRRDPNSLN